MTSFHCLGHSVASCGDQASFPAACETLHPYTSRLGNNGQLAQVSTFQMHRGIFQRSSAALPIRKACNAIEPGIPALGPAPVLCQGTDLCWGLSVSGGVRSSGKAWIVEGIELPPREQSASQLGSRRQCPAQALLDQQPDLQSYATRTMLGYGSGYSFADAHTVVGSIRVAPVWAVKLP